VEEIKLLTYKDVAGLLQVSENQVYNFVSRGQLVPLRLGRSVRFRVADVQEFFKKMAVKTR
jgi:excisionase family DNA binding protein